MKKEKWYLLLGAFALALVFAACENPAGPGTEIPPGEDVPVVPPGEELPVVPPGEELPVGPEPETDPDVLFWDALTGWQTFDSLADMGAFLENAEDNSAETPYAIRLSAAVGVADFAVSGQDNLGNLFAAFHGKYVAMDLSACTGTIIANNNKTKTQSRADTDENKLVGIILPDGLETLGNYLFYDETTTGPGNSLVSVILPASLTSIGSYTFHGAALHTITLPASLENLGTYSFMNCTSLSSVKAPDGLPNINTFQGITRACFMNTAIASFPFPATAMPIAQDAFSGTRFTSLNIPACTVINGGVFANCALLEEVTLPDGMTNMNISCFSNCPELRSITLNDGAITISGNLSSCPENLVIYVPSECNYRDNTGWGSYTRETIGEGES